MTDKIIILMRHGDYHQRPNTPSAHQPFGLTDTGRAQAVAGANLLTQMIDDQSWDLNPMVHSSALRRAWETAVCIKDAAFPHGAVISNAALNERSVGSVANLTVAEIEEILAADPRYDAPPPDWKSNSHYTLPFTGAESLMLSGQRVANYLKSVAQPGIATVCVGHGAAMRHAAHILGALDFDAIAKLSMYHATPVALALDAAGQARHVAGEWKVRQPKETPLD